MLTKIINTVLIAAIIAASLLTAKNYFNLEELRVINEESKSYILNSSSKLAEKENKYFDAYIARSGYLIANKNSFSEIGKKFTSKREIAFYEKYKETYRTLKPLDSIIKNIFLSKNWKESKSKIQEVFAKVGQLDDSLKQYLVIQNLGGIFKKNVISFEEQKKVISVSINIKSILRSRIGECQCIDPNYSFMGIPSKKVAFLGDTISVDWINYYRGHVFINQTYNIKSNYDKFHVLETSYDGCGFCDIQAESILLQEYQIPFSEIEKGEKWRSVFYFRNDKLEQDSVVLERELEF
ncbi:hypothetical protein WAF17_19490 [Bernardetia sp. ABR2-2B]|uniref:hypothetical protein n=1 Tax=Bernardetia sp. ABR2-2B TaxID=3127472 RepID=UPI0030D6232F